MQLRNIYLVTFSIGFTIAQAFFGIGGMGMEGKGSAILMAPFELMFLNWLLLMFAVFWTKHAKGVVGVLVFLLAIVAHYAITASFVVAEIDRYRLSPTAELGLGRVLARYPEQLHYGALTYLTGNLFI
jgi:hypothetical protein